MTSGEPDMFKRFTLAAAAILLGALVLDAGHSLVTPGSSSFIGSAEARVGRPLTPVSVAGAARRTVRRCAAGVYNC
jgi:hypothetical protein